MFGSNDDKNTPVPSTPASAEKPAEKKDLFGWLRKKPQAPVTPEPPSASVNEQPATPAVVAAEVTETAPVPAAPISEVAAPVESPVNTPEPQPVPVAAVEQAAAVLLTSADTSGLNPAPRPSRFRINAGSEVLHAHVEVPVVVEPVVEPPVAAPAVVEPVAAPAKSAEESRTGFLERLKQGLSKTSASLGEGMASLFLGKKVIDDDLLEDLETRLLTADVGVEATTAIIGNLTKRVARKELADSGALYKALQDELVALLKPVEQPLKIDSSKQPYVILVVGVNGAGKTTTIGKLAKKLQQDGKKVMLAAGEKDFTCPPEQSKIMYAALQKVGTPVELKIYEGEGHGYVERKDDKPGHGGGWDDRGGNKPQKDKLTFTEEGSFVLGGVYTYQVLKPTGWANPVVNNANMTNSMNNFSGNGGANVSAGVGNQQSNSLSIAAGCKACQGGNTF